MFTSPINSLFSSAAKVKLLEILYHQKAPTHLRQLAYLADLPVRSVQLALSALVHCKAVKRRKKSGTVLFSLDPDHKWYSLILDVCRALERAQIRAHTEPKLSPPAYVAFNSETLRLIHHARGEEWT